MFAINQRFVMVLAQTVQLKISGQEGQFATQAQDLVIQKRNAQEPARLVHLMLWILLQQYVGLLKDCVTLQNIVMVLMELAQMIHLLLVVQYVGLQLVLVIMVNFVLERAQLAHLMKRNPQVHLVMMETDALTPILASTAEYALVQLSVLVLMPLNAMTRIHAQLIFAFKVLAPTPTIQTLAMTAITVQREILASWVRVMVRISAKIIVMEGEPVAIHYANALTPTLDILASCRMMDLQLLLLALLKNQKKTAVHPLEQKPLG